MKRLKIILRYNLLYFILFVFIIIFIVINLILDKNKSIYDGNETTFSGEIIDYELKEDKLSFDLGGKEIIKCSYYIKNDKEYNYLLDKIKYGVKVTVNGELVEPSSNTVFHNFNYKKYLNNHGIYYTFKVSSINIGESSKNSLYWVKNGIKSRINKLDSKGYLNAFILGDKDGLNDDTYSSFSNIGITHLFAISGMHIGLLSGVILVLLKRANKFLKYIVINVFLFLYGAMLLFPASLLRCLIFFLINSLNKLFNLGVSNLKVLFLTIFVVIIFDYKMIFDMGFQFSFIIVFGILFNEKFIKDESKIKSSLKLSLITFLYSVPICLLYFYKINVLSVIYNLIFIPLVTIFVYPLALLSFIIPFVYPLFNLGISLLELLSNLFNKFDFFILYLDFNLVEVIIWYFFLLMFGLRGRKIFLVFMLVIIPIDLLIPYFNSAHYVYYFSVGQGDSALVICPYRKCTYLIDTGGLRNYKVSDKTITFLQAEGIRKIDYLILTHGDYDHMGEAINLVNNLKIEKVIFNCGEYNDLENELIKVLDKKKIKYYSCINKLDNLSFLQTKEYDNENDNSNVIYTELDGYKFMFMGDASTTTEKEILDKYNLPEIDVLKVGHHGSKTSSGIEFIDVINPKYSIISVGKNNRYGHPNKEVLDNLKNSKTYRTDKDGSIMFKIKNNKLKIETCCL